MTAALELSGTAFTYPAFPPLVGWLMGRRRASVRPFSDLTFSLAPGDHAALMGPNGAGKTTLLKIVLGLLAPSEGTVRVFGREARSAAAEGLVGFVHPEERSFYHRLTVLENLAFYGGLWGLSPQAARERARKTAASLDLERWLATPFSLLSTGTRQKVAIARALLHDPPLLAMDEPTRSLDPSAADRFREWLSGPLFRDRTLLISTHNPSEAARLAKRCLVLSNGRLVHDGEVPTGERLARMMEAPS